MDFNSLFNYNKHFINLGGYIKYLLYAITRRDLFKIVRKNTALSEKKKSDVCYVCALGPSLKTVDLTKLKGDTIVVNRFHKIGVEYPSFIPTFYLLIDALFKNDENLKDFKDALNQYINCGTTYLLNSKLVKTVDNTFNAESIYYLSCFKGMFNGRRIFKVDSVMPAFGNVACTAIAFAISLGYKKIILLGCDFNSFASRTISHCYADAKSDRLHKMSYELFCYSFNADMHDLLSKYAQEHGVSIVNSTKGSLIDAYKYEIDENLYLK